MNHFITADGYVWKLSKRGYKKLRSHVKDGKFTCLDDYGKMLGSTQTLTSIEAEFVTTSTEGFGEED